MKRCILALFCASAIPLALFAQESRGTIRGVVRDPQGAMIAGATVLVTNVETNVSSRLKTDDGGRYQAALLLPGNYSVSGEAAGFKKGIQTGVVLQLADIREVNLDLQIGAVSDQVTVTAEAPLVDVARTDAGRTIDERSVQDLPVMANTVFTMLRYAAGVQSGGPPILLGPHSTQGASDYNNGTGVGGNSWTIDGAVNDGNSRYTANLPSVDAVSETKILTNTFDGSFGHSTGLGIAVSTKIGNNQFHGVASETYWNQRWQGTNLFTKQNYFKNIAAANASGNTALANSLASQPIQPAGHSNLWSLNATGPVWIPKVFNGRNRVFFSFNYNGEKDAKPEESSTYNRIVPTAANKKGDFSDLLGVAISPQNYQLYDPLSTRADPARPGHYLRSPIPGNVLPASYIAMGSKFYNSYVNYWPDPNNWFDHTTTPNANDFLSITAPYNWTFDQYSGRMDVNLGEKTRMFGRYTQNHFVEFRGDWTVDILPGLNNTNSGGTGVTRDDQNGVLDLVYMMSPRMVAHVNASISNWDSLSSVGSTPFQFKPSSVGLPAYMDQKCALSGCYLPLMNVSGYSQNGISGIPDPTYNRFNQENADLSYNRGNHAFQVGVDIRQQIRSIHAGANDGQYTFGNNFFRQCDDTCGNGQYTAGSIGLSWASFMMGLPTGISISGNDSAYVKNPYMAFFGQDKWRVSNKLTLTLSLRAEYEKGATERFNRMIIGYDKDATLPITAGAEAAYAAKPLPDLPASQFKVRGGPIYAGTPGAPSNAWGSQLMWLPRIGFGYQVNKKTVIRGGYGIYYDTLNVNAISFGPNQQGFSLGTSTPVTTNNAQGVPIFNPAWNVAGGVSPLTDPFPQRATAGGTRFDTPVGNTLGLMSLVNGGWTYPNDKHSRMQRWRLGIERQFGSHNTIEASYEGTFTSDLNINVSQSSIPSSYYSMTTTRPQTACTATVTTNCLWDTYLNGTVPNPFGIANFASIAGSDPALYKYMQTNNTFYTSGTISRASLIRAYPSGNITTPNPIGKARSQQFELTLNHRFSSGFTANVAYTAMVTKSATGFFQPWNPFDATNPQVPNWTRGGAAPNRIAATFVYDLPFGKGRQFLHNAILNQIVGGWTLSGTYEAQPGGLLGFGNQFYYGDVNNIKIDDPTFGHYFNTAGCVASAAAAGPGDTVVPVGQPCTQGWEKRTNQGPGTYQMRSFPNNVDGLRGPGYQQWNASVKREFKIRERLKFETRLDAINLTNHSFVGGPNLTPTSSQFGQITGGAANLNRFIQIQGHLRW